MDNIAHIFCNPEEEFLTIPPMRAFAKSNRVNVDTDSDIKENTKAKLLEAVFAFGNENENNSELVAEWIDDVAREGIKEIVLHKCSFKPNIEMLFSDEDRLKKYLDTFVDQESTGHLINSKYDEKVRLIKYRILNMRGKRVVTLYCCSMATYIDKRKLRARDIEFPVIFDIFIDGGWYIVRYKPRSNLYDYNPGTQSIEGKMQYPMSLDKPVRTAETRVKKIFEVEEDKSPAQTYFLKKIFYRLLKSFTDTPPEILQIINENNAAVEDIKQLIGNICAIQGSQSANLDSDIRNLLEKYISINWPDKNIFTRNREAYPIKLCATDAEESHVDQTAGGDFGPLQSKEVFFDNKRMIENDQMCDGLTLKWKRRNRKYYSSETFTVRISEKKGKCYLSFKEYTAEEDIQNVLFSIIDAQGCIS